MCDSVHALDSALECLCDLAETTVCTALVPPRPFSSSPNGSYVIMQSKLHCVLRISKYELFTVWSLYSTWLLLGIEVGAPQLFVHPQVFG